MDNLIPESHACMTNSPQHPDAYIRLIDQQIATNTNINYEGLI
jgi:hypothetical protein